MVYCIATWPAGQCLYPPRPHLRWALVFLLVTTRTLAKEKFCRLHWKVRKNNEIKKSQFIILMFTKASEPTINS